jgi:hypothetical protein
MSLPMTEARAAGHIPGMVRAAPVALGASQVTLASEPMVAPTIGEVYDL